MQELTLPQQHHFFTHEIHVKYHRNSVKLMIQLDFIHVQQKGCDWHKVSVTNSSFHSSKFTEAPRIPGNDTTSNHSKRGRRSRRGGPSWRRQAPTKTSRKTRHTGEKIQLASWYWKISYPLQFESIPKWYRYRFFYVFLSSINSISRVLRYSHFVQLLSIFA